MGAAAADTAAGLTTDYELHLGADGVIVKHIAVLKDLHHAQQPDVVFYTDTQKQPIGQGHFIAVLQGGIFKVSGSFAAGNPLSVSGENGKKLMLRLIGEPKKALRGSGQP